MAKSMALALGATTISFDDVNGMQRRPDWHNRRERRAESGALYVSIFGQKLLMETTVVMDDTDRTQMDAWHAAGSTLTFYDQYSSGTASLFNVKLLGNQNPSAKWTKVGGWYRTTLRIAEI